VGTKKKKTLGEVPKVKKMGEGLKAPGMATKTKQSLGKEERLGKKGKEGTGTHCNQAPTKPPYQI